MHTSVENLHIDNVSSIPTVGFVYIYKSLIIEM